jgi:hypothetical protein
MLQRMTERKEIKSQKIENKPTLYMLNTTNRLKGGDKIKHEFGGSDLFTALYPHLEAWSFEPAIDSDRGDRGAKIDGKIFYFEVDRCTEGFPKIQDKIDNYRSYMKRTGEVFHVVFSLLEDDPVIERRGQKLLNLFAENLLGSQFLICNHRLLVENPLGEVLFSEKEGFRSLKTLDW